MRGAVGGGGGVRGGLYWGRAEQGQLTAVSRGGWVRPYGTF